MRKQISMVCFWLAILAFAVHVLPISPIDSLAAAGSDSMADRILYNGKVVTVDSKFSIAEAVAIKDDKIIAVGTNDQILALALDRTERIDLGGKTVIPGLTESHTHITQAAESEFFGELYIPTSVEALLGFISKKVDTLKEGEWIYFRNTYPTRLKEYRFPNFARA